MINKAIIVIQNNYPFAKGEPFFETEIDYLCDNFGQVIIVTQNCKDKQTRKVPKGIKIYRFNKYFTKKKFIKYPCIIFTKDFWKEIYIIKKIYKSKINIAKIKDLIVWMIRAKLLEKFIKGIIKENNLEKFDQIILYNYWFDYTPYACLNFKEKNEKYKVITRVHGRDFVFERTKCNYIPLKKAILDRIDKIYFASQYGKKYIENKLNVINHPKMKVSHLGIDNNFSKSKKSDDNIFRIISISNTITLKRIDLIIKALSLIDKFQIHWTHIGSGEEFDDFLQLANDLLEPKKNIEFEFKGLMLNKDIYKYYELHPIDLFITTSRTEGGVPVSIMEACSFAVPIIGTDVGGIPEIVKQGQNGFIISPNPTPEEIAEAIKKIICSTDDQKTLYRNNSYKIWFKNYKGKNNYLNFIKDLESL